MLSNRISAILACLVFVAAGCSELTDRLPWQQDQSEVQDEHDHTAGEPHDDTPAEPAHEDNNHAAPRVAEDAADHEEHDEHEEGVVHIDPARLATLNLTTAVVHRGTVTTTIALPAEVQFDPDRVAHIVPRVAGIVREVHAGIGDVVAEGELLAVLDSRELAEAKSTYLASLAMRDLAQATYQREARLYEQEISSEQDYLEAKQAYEETGIKVRTAQQSLHALGLSVATINQLGNEAESALTRYEIRAPFGATVVERHITQGETIGLDDQVYFLAQLDPVWVMGRASERDIRKIEVAQQALIHLDALPGEEFEGRVDYVGSMLDPQSRTAEVRVVLPNPKQDLRAGMFGRMTIFLEEHEHAEAMLVPLDAMQRTETGDVVYRIRAEGEYEVVAVEVLHASEDFAEVQGALAEGDVVAAGDTFVLKSEAGKEEMGGGHSH
ncbi:MAG: efflux RND transporter periplasmic adaptor subunit [Candidatus Hydrogenedentales bacterium]